MNTLCLRNEGVFFFSFVCLFVFVKSLEGRKEGMPTVGRSGFSLLQRCWEGNTDIGYGAGFSSVSSSD